MSNFAEAKSLLKKKEEEGKINCQAKKVICLDPLFPIKPWEASGRSGKTELSLQEIKHEMKIS